MSGHIKPEYMALIDDCPECKATAMQSLDGFDYSKALAMLEQRTDISDAQKAQAIEQVCKYRDASRQIESSHIKEYKGGQP